MSISEELLDLIKKHEFLMKGDLDAEINPISKDTWDRSIDLMSQITMSQLDDNCAIIPTIWYGANDGVDITWENSNGKLIVATAEDPTHYEYLFIDKNTKDCKKPTLDELLIELPKYLNLLRA